MKLKLPDGTTFEGTPDECRIYGSGFCDALGCFGIWKDGEQFIGAWDMRVEDLQRDIFVQLLCGEEIHDNP